MTQPLTNGHTVRAIRRARGIRQDHLADRAEISKSYLSRLERGDRHPLPLVTGRIADALNVSTRVLTGQVSPIQVLREITGISARELAAATGVTITRLQRIEQGADTPGPELAAALAARLGCPAEALLPVYGRPSGRVA